MKNAMSALETVELSRMVLSVAEGMAQAQMNLDLNSMRLAEAYAMTELDMLGEQVSLLELGLTPSFYQFVDTTIAMKISISMTEEHSEEKTTSESKSKTESETAVSVSVGWFSVSASVTTTTTTTTSSVDARFASRFQYSTEASSALTTRLIPVPPPTALMQIARGLATE